MNFYVEKVLYVLLSVLILVAYGLLTRGIVAKITARVGGRYGMRFYQPYIDIVKNYAKQTSISHGVMFWLGPVFRLSGGIGLVTFMPIILGSVHFSNFSFAGDMLLIMYFMFFGTLGMALGAGQSGHPYAAMGISRGLAQTTAFELPMNLALIAIIAQYQTLSLTDIVMAQQGGFQHWTLFTNPIASITLILTYLGAMGRSPFDVVLAPQEIPIGPPTEYQSTFLGLLQTNRAIFPTIKGVLFVNILAGGASSWGELFTKVFILNFIPVIIAVVYPRYRVDQSIRWFLKLPLALGILAILLVSFK